MARRLRRAGRRARGGGGTRARQGSDMAALSARLDKHARRLLVLAARRSGPPPPPRIPAPPRRLSPRHPSRAGLRPAFSRPESGEAAPRRRRRAVPCPRLVDGARRGGGPPWRPAGGGRSRSHDERRAARSRAGWDCGGAAWPGWRSMRTGRDGLTSEQDVSTHRDGLGL